MLARHVFLRHIQVPSAERESVAVDTASNKLTHVYAFRSRSRKLERYGIYALKKTPPPPPPSAGPTVLPLPKFPSSPTPNSPYPAPNPYLAFTSPPT